MTPGYPDGRPRGRLNRARQVAATVLTVLFAVLLPVAVTGAWIRGTVLSNSGYVAAVSPVAADPTVHAAVQSAAAEEISPLISHAADELPSVLGLLARSLDGGLQHMVSDGINGFMTTPAFQRMWVSANRSAHSQLIGVLNGSSAAVATTNGEVVLNLAPLISSVLKELASQLSSLTGKSIRAPAISAVPGAACRQIADLTGARLPADCGQIPLFPASALNTARRAFRVISAITLALLILAPLTAATALLAAPRRRRVLLQLGIGGAVTVSVAAIAMARLRSTLVGRAQPRWQPAVGVIAHAVTRGFFSLIILCVASGFVLAAAAWLSLSYTRFTEVRARSAESVRPASR